MAVPSFEQLLEQARQISQYKAEQAQPQTGELLAQGLAGLGHSFLNAPIGEKQTFVGTVDPQTSKYTSFKTPQQTGGTVSDLFARKLSGQSQETTPEGSVPITQTQFADKGLANIFKKTNRPLTTQSAFESGYASIDMLRDAFPDKTDDALKLASVGELQQTLSSQRAAATAGAPKAVPSEQVDKIVQMRNAIDGSNEIRTQFFNLIGKGTSPVDPIGGRFSDLAKTMGVLDDAEVTKFQTDLIAQMNTYLNSISGAAISPDEAKRLIKRLPKVGSTKEQFLGEMDSFDAELKRSLGNRIKTLKDANYKVGDLEKFIPSGSKETPKNTDKKTGGTAEDILKEFGLSQ